MQIEDEVGGLSEAEIQARREQAEKNVASSKARQEKRQAARDGGNTGDEVELPISEAAMLGLPEPAKVGPLKLLLKAPVIRLANRLFGELLTTYPDLLVYAALSDRFGKGISITKAVDAARAIMEDRIANLKAQGAKDDDPGVIAASETFTEEDAYQELQNFIGLIGSYSKENEQARRAKYMEELKAFRELEEKGEDIAPMPLYKPHALEKMAGILAHFALPYSTGPDGEPLRPEDLAELLATSLRPHDFADLLRAQLRAASGSDTPYDSDAFANFGTL